MHVHDDEASRVFRKNVDAANLRHGVPKLARAVRLRAVAAVGFLENVRGRGLRRLNLCRLKGRERRHGRHIALCIFLKRNLFRFSRFLCRRQRRFRAEKRHRPIHRLKRRPLR